MEQNHADPIKVEAVMGMSAATDKPDVKWGQEQAKALHAKERETLSNAPIMSYFDSSAQSMIKLISASRYSLGACLLQQGKPVA